MENKLINYEVSVWEDTYVAAATANAPAEGSTNVLEGAGGGENYVDFNLTELHEVKLGIIGSTNSSFGGNIFEPQLISNVNGTHTFTFSIHTEYFNPMTGVIEHNPYVDWLVNERKIKLRRDDKKDDSGNIGKWYDFIIKNISEDSTNKKITYTCKDAHVCELSKDGFEIELSTELNNNMGSAQDLAKYVMKGADWEVPAAGENGSEMIIQYSQPNAMWDGTTEREIIKSKVQKFNPVLGEVVTKYLRKRTLTAEDVIVKILPGNKPESFEGYEKVDENGKVILYHFENQGLSLQFYYDGLKWTETNIKETQYPYFEYVWGYSQKDFISSRTVVNLIDNWKDFKNSYGFKAINEGGFVKQILLNNGTHQPVSITTLNEEFTSYLRMKGTILCDVFDAKKEKMLEYWKNQIPLRLKYKTYKNKDIDFSLSEYSYENGNLVKGKAIYEQVNGNGVQILRPCVKITEEEFKTKKIGLFINLVEEIDLKELEFYPYILDNNNNEILPLYSLNAGEAAGNIESIVREKYYLYNEDLNQLKTSPEEYVYEYVGDSIPEGVEVITTEEKRTSIEASKSNRFNILQTIAEKFECWIRFRVEHAIDGSITSKKIIFVQELGTIEAPGFKYGLNLKGITRQVDSEQIVSKLIVQPNSNEFAAGGACTITRADGNAVRENFIYNLQYFVDMGLLDADSAKSDLLNLHSKLATINTDKLNLLNKLDELYTTTLGYKADVEAYSALYQEASDNLIDAKKRIAEMTAHEWNWWKSSEAEKNNNYKEWAEAEYLEKLNKRRYSATPAQILTQEQAEDLNMAVMFPNDPAYGNSVNKTEDDGKIKVYVYKENFFRFNQVWGRFSEDPRNEATLSDFASFLEGVPTSERESYLVYQTGTTIPDYLLTYNKYNIVSPSQSTGQIYSRYEYYYNKHKQQVEGWAGTASFNKLIIEIKTLEKAIETYNLQSETATSELTKISNEYDEKIKKLNENSLNVTSIINAFEKKYSRYIQEGTWISEDYIDDTKYFDDAKFVFAQSWQPKISYTINVVDIAAATLVPEVDYSMYTYNCGEKSTIEDVEFFGYENGRPKKVEIIIEELSEKFDSPDQNTIKVQNYTTYFDSLFHRIEAATQTVEFNTGKYARAADIVNPEGYIDISMLQSAFDNGEWSLSQLSDQSVTWADGKGIKISSPKDSDRQVRLANMGIFLTTDGGATWKTGITGDGIHADVITTGQLNTNNILIGNSETPMFRWDKEGISAYKFDKIGELTTNYNSSVYVRFNQYGLYGVGNYNEEIKDNILDEIWNNSSFYLGWRGFCFRGFQGDTETILDNQSIKILKNGEAIFFVDNNGIITANNLRLYGGLIQSNDYAEALITEVYEEEGQEKQKEKIVVSSGAKIDLKNGYFYTPSFTLDRDGLTTGNVKASKISSEYSAIEEMDIISRLKYISKGSGTENNITFSSTINQPVKGTWTRADGKITLSNWNKSSGKYYNEYMFWRNDSDKSVKLYIEFEGRGNCYIFTSAKEISDGSYPYIYANAMSFSSTQNSYKQTITVPAGEILYILFATLKSLNTDDQPKIIVARILANEFIFNVEENGLETNKFFLYDEHGNKYKITVSGSSLVATKQ